MGVNFASGAFGGGLATLLTQPQDLVKTRMQIMDQSAAPPIHPRVPGAEAATLLRRNGRSVTETVRAVYAEAGVAGFFRGTYPRFLKRMLGSAITWMIFEETVKVYAALLPAKADALLETVTERRGLRQGDAVREREKAEGRQRAGDR
jgi:hypothetical protein